MFLKFVYNSCVPKYSFYLVDFISCLGVHFLSSIAFSINGLISERAGATTFIQKYYFG